MHSSASGADASSVSVRAAVGGKWATRDIGTGGECKQNATRGLSANSSAQRDPGETPAEFRGDKKRVLPGLSSARSVGSERDHLESQQGLATEFLLPSRNSLRVLDAAEMSKFTSMSSEGAESPNEEALKRDILISTGS